MHAPPVTEIDRAWTLTAIEAIRHSVNAAELDDAETQCQDAATWAMSLLGELRTVADDLAWLRAHLTRVASDASIGARDIAAQAGISHPTAARWARAQREQGLPPDRPTLWHLNLQNEDEPGAEALIKQLGRHNISSSAAQRVRDQLLKRDSADLVGAHRPVPEPTH